MAKHKILTAARLREALHYDPNTGQWTRLPNNKSKKKKVGSLNHAGHKRYHAISLDNRPYLAHRLAWLYMTGEWPKGDVDHINGDTLDNRWENLRDVTHKQNSYNRFAKGVYLTRNGSWLARTKEAYLGCFPTYERAFAVYRDDAIRRYGEYGHSSLNEDLVSRRNRIISAEIKKLQRLILRLKAEMAQPPRCNSGARSPAPSRRFL